MCGSVGLGPCSVPTSAPTRKPSSTPTPAPSTKPSTIADECVDSTEPFLWNENKNTFKTCKNLEKKPENFEKWCKKKKDGKKVWDWCPEMCGSIGLGPCPE